MGTILPFCSSFSLLERYPPGDTVIAGAWSRGPKFLDVGSTPGPRTILEKGDPDVLPVP